MIASASGVFGDFSASLSHSTRLPKRTASSPTKRDSVNGAEYQNPDLASLGLPVLQASRNSLRWPPIFRGMVLAGMMKSFIRDSGTSRGVPDQPPARMQPLSPTK